MIRHLSKDIRRRARRSLDREERGAGPITGVVALVLAIAGVWAAVQAALPVLLRERIARELSAMGLEGARFRIASVGWSSLRLADVQLADDLDAASVLVAYGDPTELLAGRIRGLTVQGARWTTALDPDAIAESTPVRLLASGLGESGALQSGIRFEGARVTLERREGDSVILDLDADLRGESGQVALVVRSPWGEHVVDVRVTRGDPELTVDSTITPVGGTEADALVVSLAIEGTGEPRIAWRASGSVPEDVARDALPGIELEGDVQASSHGVARATDGSGGWRLDEIGVTLSSARARIPSLEIEAEDVSADLLATRSSDGALALDPRSRISVARARWPHARIESAVLSPAVRIEGFGTSAATLRSAGETHLSMAVLAVGDGDAAETRFREIELTIAEDGEGPFFAIDAHRVTARFDGSAAFVTGALRGRDVVVAGGLEAQLDARGMRVSMPLTLDVRALGQEDSQASLTRARFELPLAWDETGELSVAGSMRAREMRWRDVGLGPTRGTVRVADGRLTLDWTGHATRDARFRMRTSIGLENGRVTVDLDVPPSEVRAGDAFQRVLARASGVEVLGRAGAHVHVTPGAPGGGGASVALVRAALRDEEGRGSARGVSATVVLTSIDPIVSAAADRVTFDEIAIGDVLRTRKGSARVRFAGSGLIDVEDAVATLGGGRLRVAPFQLRADDPDLALDLTIDGIRLDRLVQLLAHDRASASGLLDGHIAVRWHLGERPSIVVGEGELAARGPGRLQVTGNAVALPTPIDLEELPSGAWLEQRVIAALSDFAYSRLRLDVVREEGASHLHAQVSGHGATTPQEINLDVDVGDIQLLVDESLHLLNRDARARPARMRSPP